MDEPYKVLYSAELGRYGVAARDLKAGEVVLEDRPFAIGPKVDSSPLCLECCRPVDGGRGGPKCPECGWPMCEECAADKQTIVYHKKECALFAKHKAKFQAVEDSTASCMQLDCITPLRMLLAKEEHPERWDAEISVMEYHNESRNGSATWQQDQQNVVGYLRFPCGLKDRFSEEVIQQVIGILDVNAFEVRTSKGYSARGLYPKLGVMAHSCVCNVVHSIHPSNNFRLIARVAIDVPEGEKLYTIYTHSLTGTSTRQGVLTSSKFFTCHCTRCLDPTELGTHFSSLKCQKCDNGLIVSSDPLDDGAEWKCTDCEYKAKGTAVQKVVQLMQAEVDSLTSMAHGPGKLTAYEKIFKKYRSVLHPSHYINISIRHSLIELYGRVPGYEMQELPDILLERKIELCRDIQRVLDILEPGKTRSRAMILYELHGPIVMLAQSMYQQGVLDGAPLKERLEEAANMLDECASILEWEDSTSPEGILANVAKQSAEQLKDSIKILS